MTDENRTIADQIADEVLNAARPKARPVADILVERNKTHGDFADHAEITQVLKNSMRYGKNWDTLSHAQREALEMIAHKVGRILSGDPAHADHWDDIAGYALLGKKG